MFGGSPSPAPVGATAPAPIPSAPAPPPPIPAWVYMTADQLGVMGMSADFVSGYQAGVFRGPMIPPPRPQDDWVSYELWLLPLKMYDGTDIGAPVEYAIGFNSAIENGMIYRWMWTNDPNSPVIGSSGQQIPNVR